jgi:hypothetical protein
MGAEMTRGLHIRTSRDKPLITQVDITHVAVVLRPTAK